MSADPIARPDHYRRFPVECVAFTRHMTFLAGNAFKYAYRHADKGQEESDLRKCLQYLRWCAEAADPVFHTPHGAVVCRALWDDAVAPAWNGTDAAPGSHAQVWVGARRLLDGRFDALAVAAGDRVRWWERGGA